MTASQHEIGSKIFRRAAAHERIKAAVLLLIIVVFFGIFHAAGRYNINIGRLAGPCGFKQKYDLPCPGCGMTTAVLAFSQGRIGDAFYIQPAAGLLCSVGVVCAFLAFFVAVFGLYFKFIDRLFEQIKTRHIVIGVLIIIAAGWSVTLARALAAAK